MNEIERLISRLPRPSPSKTLDDRISELEGWPPLVVPEIASGTRPPRSLRAVLRRIAAFAATAACAGVAGFALGRQSAVSPKPEGGSVTAAPMLAAAAPEPPALPVVIVREESEALARFVMPTRFESMLGNGPLVDKSESPLPLE